MSEFISIGTACNVKHQIDKHYGKKNTLFFDWLMTDIKSVVSILTSNIDLILENVAKEPDGIKFKSLSYCVAIHDSMDDFVDKYKRRYNRLIELIKSHKKLYFIRFGAVDETGKKSFINAVKLVNPHCNFTLISIGIQHETKSIKNEPHYLEIKLTDLQVPGDWTTSYLDWKEIFTIIEEN